MHLMSSDCLPRDARLLLCVAQECFLLLYDTKQQRLRQGRKPFLAQIFKWEGRHPGVVRQFQWNPGVCIVQSSRSLLIQPSPPLQMVTHPAALRCSCATREEVDIFLAENVRSEKSKFALIIPYLLEVLSILSWVTSGMLWNRDTIALPLPPLHQSLGLSLNAAKTK